jgi:hypothetical protein
VTQNNLPTRSQRLACLLAACALADPAMAAPGEHVVIGNTVIEPAVSIGVEGRTNVFLSVGVPANAEASGLAYNPRDAAVPGINFHLAPTLAIKSTAPELSISFNGRYDLRKYFPGFEGQRVPPEALYKLDRFSDFDAKLAIVALPERVIGFNLSDHAAIRNFPSDSAARENALLTQFRNDLLGGVTIRAGSSISVDAGAAFGYNDYRVPSADPNAAGGQAGLNSRMEIGPTLAVKWLFFPRTAAVVEGQYSWHTWKSNWISASGNRSGAGLGDFLGMPDSQHFKLMTGLRGRVTDRLVVSLLGGWGYANYDEQTVIDEAAALGASAEAVPGDGRCDSRGKDDTPRDCRETFAADITGAEGILGLARIEYDLGRGQRVVGQYRHDFADSFFTNSDIYHDVSLELASEFGARFSTLAKFGVRFEDFDGEVDRDDILLRLQGDATYKFTDWIALTGGAWWTQRASSFADVQYDDVNIHIATTFSY